MPSAASQATSSPPISARSGEGEEGGDEDHLRQAGRRQHRDVVAPAGDDDHHREGERREEREAVAPQTALARGAEHHRHARQRERHRQDRAARDRLAERHPRQHGGEHGSDGQDEQDACDARVIERGDEAGRRGRDAQRHGDARNPDRPERLQHPAVFDDRDIGEQRSARERRSAENLRGRVERELALEDAGGRPRDCGERHIDLPAPLALRPLERHRRSRHAVKS